MRGHEMNNQVLQEAELAKLPAELRQMVLALSEKAAPADLVRQGRELVEMMGLFRRAEELFTETYAKVAELENRFTG